MNIEIVLIELAKRLHTILQCGIVVTRRSSAKRFSSVPRPSQEPFQVFWRLALRTWTVSAAWKDGGELIET